MDNYSLPMTTRAIGAKTLGCLCPTMSTLYKYDKAIALIRLTRSDCPSLYYSMNILKVGSSPYYYFQSTTKATDAVKLFSPRLRRRKAMQVSSLAGR